MVRHLAGFAALWMMAAALGCGPGVSEEEAKVRCDQERLANGTNCIDDAAYSQCLSCEQECGDQCLRLESCPQQYTCPQ